MKRIAWIALGCQIFLISASAYANDSIARVGAGGLTLLKTDNIRMVKEVLEISTFKIRVQYRFLNESKEDIKTTVAFPMPAYGWNPGFSESMANVMPLDSFKMLVDGHEVDAQENRIAVINDVDVTGELRKLGLSDKQIFETFGDCVVHDDGGTFECGLTEAQNTKIAQMFTNGYKWSRWKVSETAYWEQVFPAGEEIEIIHEYQPFVGLYPGYGPSDISEVCLDNRTSDAMRKRFESRTDKDDIGSRSEVEYILGTGRNWKGPIKNFKLVIQKNSPDEIVSLCFPGKPKRTSPTTIEFTHSNFVPQDKLIVHFYDIGRHHNDDE